jgi:hypothetical protein
MSALETSQQKQRRTPNPHGLVSQLLTYGFA